MPKKNYFYKGARPGGSVPSSGTPSRRTPASGRRGGNGSAYGQTRGYTMAEEARNTAHNRSGPLGRDARLRHKPIIFVSAGFMNPLQDFEVAKTLSSPTSKEKFPVTKGDGRERDDEKTGVVSGDGATALQRLSAWKGASTPESATGQLTIESLSLDTTQSRPSHAKQDPKHTECISEYDSSEEIIIFKGRNPGHQQRNVFSSKKAETISKASGLDQTKTEMQPLEQTIKKCESENLAIETGDYISLNPQPRRRRSPRRPRRSTASDDEAAVLADYMENLRNQEGDEGDDGFDRLGSDFHGFQILRDLGGTDSDTIRSRRSSEDDDVESGSEAESKNKSFTHQQESEDERLAQILAKQEELGLDSDDVLLLVDGDSSDWLAAPKSQSHRKTLGAAKHGKSTQQRGQFPDATQMVQAFDEMDLMDLHHYKLGNSRKGSKPFVVSDSELEEVINMTWKKDRLKKAEKKRAREELRSEGLLKTKANPNDLRIKYRGGMSLDDLADEMEAFLLGSHEQLILPPLDKHARKSIHLVASQLGIKSQSAGKGTDRYPILRRSKATLPFDQFTFERVLGSIKRPWFPRVDVDAKAVSEARVFKRAEARNGKSRFNNRATTLREGDVVGQHAAELGVENKGRAMLEKMGWSKGMALGSEENKGIIVPITHVVKKTKAGLGDA